MDKKRIENAVKEILSAIGEDPGRDGLKNTPSRVARMYAEILAGHDNGDPGAHLETTKSAQCAGQEMVVYCLDADGEGTCSADCALQ